MRQSWPELLLRACSEYPKRPFLSNIGKPSVTYEDAGRRIATIAQRLSDLGLKRGDRLACYSDRIDPSIYLVSACSAMGVLFVCVAQQYSLQFIEDIKKHVGSKFIYCDPDNAMALRARGHDVLVIDAPKGMEGVIDLTAGAPPADALAVLAKVSRDVVDTDPLILISTSGSTGNPKLVERDNRSLVRNTRVWGDSIRSFGLPEHRFLMVHTLTHGWGYAILSTAIAMGGELLGTTKSDTSASLDEVRALNPNIIATTPRVLNSFATQADQAQPGGRIFGEGLRVIYSTGAKSDPGLLGRLQQQGVDTIEIYGSAETGFMAITPKGGWRPDRVAPLLPDVQMRFEADGAILVKTPAMMTGYYGNAEMTAKVWTDDRFYRNGDIGELDPQGYLRVFGRKADHFLTHEGSYIFPSSIEQRLEGQPSIAQAILAGDGKPFLTAFIVPRERPTGGDADGFLPPEKFPELYAKAEAEIAQVNAQLERVEHVKRVLLFAKPFEADIYKTVAIGKVNRQRKEFMTRYATHLDTLYPPRR